MEESGSLIYQFIAAGAANLAAFITGINVAWTSAIYPMLASNVSTPKSLLEIFPRAKPITDNGIAIVTGILTIGGFVGSLAACSMIIQYGRKYTLILGCFPFLMTYILSALGNQTIFLYTLRFLFGISVGIVLTIMPMYIGEIAEEKFRATIGCITQFSLTLGYMYAFVNVPTMDVFWFAATCSLITILAISLLLIFGIESPFYLAEFNDNAANKTLQRLRGTSNVATEMMSIKLTVESARRRPNMSCVEILRTEQLRKCLTITAGLAMFQQLSGCSVCIFYMSFIIKESGYSMDVHFASFLFATLQAVVCLLVVYCIRFFDYRPLLLVTIVTSGFANFFFALMLYSSNFEKPALFTFGVILMSNSAGLCNVTFVLTSEIYRYDVKNFGNTFTAVTYWFFGIIASFVFLPFSRKFGMYSMFFIFSGMNILAAIFVMYVVPDLNNRTFRDIQTVVATWRNNRIQMGALNRAFENRFPVRQRIVPFHNAATFRNEDNARGNLREENSYQRRENLEAEVAGALEAEELSQFSLGDWDRIWSRAGTENELCVNSSDARLSDAASSHSLQLAAYNFLAGPSRNSEISRTNIRLKPKCIYSSKQDIGGETHNIHFNLNAPATSNASSHLDDGLVVNQSEPTLQNGTTVEKLCSRFEIDGELQVCNEKETESKENVETINVSAINLEINTATPNCVEQ